MSVIQTHYVMLGNRYKYDEFYERIQRRVATNPRDAKKDLDNWRDNVEKLYLDKANNGITNYNGITIVSDGMNGEYVCIGYVIAKSGEYNDLEDYSAVHPNIWDDVGDDIVKAVGFAEEIEILTFTHYR